MTTGSPYAMTRFSQVDPLYKSIRLGTSTSTIGAYGCLLCSLASVVVDFKVRVAGRYADPGQLNRWLARHKGFSDGNKLVFAAVNGLPGVRFSKLIDANVRPAPVGEIAQALADGKGVLVEVDHVPGGTRQQHWVRLLPEEAGLTAEQQLAYLETDALIMDPWMPPGSEVRWLMPAYAAPEWDNPARAIFRVAIYERTAVESVASIATAEPSQAAQPTVYFRV